MSQEPVKYDARHIKVLEGLEAVRRRPGMYIGSTGERGLHHLVLEAAGRALNEVLAGRAGLVEIVLLPDGGIRVADDGPGATFEPCGAVGDPGLHNLLTRLSVGERALASTSCPTWDSPSSTPCRAGWWLKRDATGFGRCASMYVASR